MAKNLLHAGVVKCMNAPCTCSCSAIDIRCHFSRAKRAPPKAGYVTCIRNMYQSKR